MSREVALVGVLVFAFIALGGVAAQYETSVVESQPLTTVDNESFNVTEDTLVRLNDSNRDVIYNDTAHVYQNSSEIGADGNWTWFPGNGTLAIQQNTHFNESRDAFVTYNYTEPAGEQQLARDVALVPYLLGDGLGIIVGAALLLTAIVVLGRQR